MKGISFDFLRINLITLEVETQNVRSNIYSRTLENV